MTSKLQDHPTVKQFQAKQMQGLLPTTTDSPDSPDSTCDAQWLRRLCLDAGADDVGFVSIDRPELDDQRADILRVFPHAQTLISFVCKMNREPVRSPARSVANNEFHHVSDKVTAVSHTIAAALEAVGIRALNEPMGFPMEVGHSLTKPWIIAHKPIAVAAGLGRMGIHRNVIHPKFGNFILLGTVLTNAIVTEESKPVEFNPCLECKLCVAACPVGAISADGHFNFAACYTHNYREFMGGFTDWVEQIADSKDAQSYRAKVTPNETASMWQSLAIGPNYKAAYCMAVCPAGEDVISPFLTNRKGFLEEVVKPLQAKEETIYVVAGSDAEEYTQRRFPHKPTKRIHSGMRATSIQGLLRSMPLVFQRNQSRDLDATFHFTFTGAEPLLATVIIRNQTIQVQEGHVGSADFHLTADSRTWLRILAREQRMFGAILTRKIRWRGPVRLLRAFGKCFPV